LMAIKFNYSNLSVMSSQNPSSRIT